MLREYKVVVNGIETTLNLSDEDAKARGLTAKKAAAAVAPTDSEPAPTTKGSAIEVGRQDEKAVTAANKARAAANKAAEKPEK